MPARRACRSLDVAAAPGVTPDAPLERHRRRIGRRGAGSGGPDAVVHLAAVASDARGPARSRGRPGWSTPPAPPGWRRRCARREGGRPGRSAGAARRRPARCTARASPVPRVGDRPAAAPARPTRRARSGREVAALEVARRDRAAGRDRPALPAHRARASRPRSCCRRSPSGCGRPARTGRRDGADRQPGAGARSPRRARRRRGLPRAAGARGGRARCTTSRRGEGSRVRRRLPPARRRSSASRRHRSPIPSLVRGERTFRYLVGELDQAACARPAGRPRSHWTQTLRGSAGCPSGLTSRPFSSSAPAPSSSGRAPSSTTPAPRRCGRSRRRATGSSWSTRIPPRS